MNYEIMRKYIKQFGCALIGWNPQILAQCGEASIRQFYKLTSAMLIMIVIWGTIGFCFAQNYLNLKSIFPQIFVALAFVVIIICIERVIILTVGKARVMGAIRVLLAIVMATLGSTIFDQMIFRNDIKAELESIRLQKIETVTASKVKDIERTISQLRTENDSLNTEFEKKNAEFQKSPVMKFTAVDAHTVSDGVDSLGNPKYKKVYDTRQEFRTNPIQQELDLIKNSIDKNGDKYEELLDKKLNMRKSVEDDYATKPAGFIEELMATIQVVSQKWYTITFYAVMFVFLLLLETFVVSIKLADTKCDYDLIVEHQLRIKELKLKASEDKIKESFVTKTMKDESSGSIS